jgi:hypothetical protein
MMGGVKILAPCAFQREARMRSFLEVTYGMAVRLPVEQNPWAIRITPEQMPLPAFEKRVDFYSFQTHQPELFRHDLTPKSVLDFAAAVQTLLRRPLQATEPRLKYRE